MRNINRFQDANLAKGLLNAIERKLDQLPTDSIRLMEVCGTHTVNIFRSGLRSLLPEKTLLLSGPGCPVCVTTTNYIDCAIQLARRDDIAIATFGDMLKVPGSASTLEKERAGGADVRVVYSVTNALKLARAAPAREIVFLGVGFETTAPTIASAIIEARNEAVRNFSVLPAHKLIPPAMEALLCDKAVKIDAFLCPGHVSAIIGAAPYQRISEKYGKPCVVTGFEPLDVLQAILMVLRQLERGEAAAEIQYTRCVKWDGNPAALKLMETVFEREDAEWRGLGVIPASGLKVKEEFCAQDAFSRFRVKLPESHSDPRCACGDVLRAVKTPHQCRMFARICTPETPLGPCMVSSEGTCSAYFKYARGYGDRKVGRDSEIRNRKGRAK